MELFQYFPPGTPRGRSRAVPLDRRGFHYGFVSIQKNETRDGGEESWRASEPIYLQKAGAAAVKKSQSAIEDTLQLFDAARAGESFFDAMRERIHHSKNLQIAGAATDLADPREIEKVFAAIRGKGAGARDLYAKLSWIAHDRRDPSLRIRFSFGSERMQDWTRSPRRAAFADAYAEATFPECAVITKNRPLVARIERYIHKKIRFSERILYNNAPGGGAVFHHDAEPSQLGVAYAQLAGETAWLAVPKRTLAGLLATRLRRAPAAILKQLDRHGDAKLEKLLNRSRDLVRELVERGHFYHLHAGDILLLPSSGPDDVAWHSVFATGTRPSLSLSFGIFKK